MIATAANAQTDTSGLTFIAQKDSSAAKIADRTRIDLSSGKLGDQAPPLRVGDWIKGSPVKALEKGKMYVLDFWGTWCGPCIAAMPHLTALARKYKQKVTFAAIDVFENHGNRAKSTDDIKKFVAGMGEKMDVNVALEDTSFTIHDWVDNYHQDYLPTTFIIDGNGKVAWIGSSLKIDTVIKRVINQTWDIGKELSTRRYTDSSKNYFLTLDTSVYSKVRRFLPPYNGRNYLGFPDSTLMVIDEMVKKEPKLKYAPTIAYYTFLSLLLTDPHKAYEYGKQVIVTPTYEPPAYESILRNVREDVLKLTPPKEIYLLGAACYQAEIDNNPSFNEYDLGRYYHEMADWYYKGGDKEKAIAAEKKVIKYWKKQIKSDSK
jgi:thiol-disulfide isomerase/thioredoxin